MTHGTLDNIRAVAPDGSTAVKPFKYMPPNLTPSVVVSTLASLGLTVPTKLTAAAASGSLRSADYKFALKEVDAALSKADVPISDRFRFKEALSHNGILGT
jgi:hypothetical protein